MPKSYDFFIKTILVGDPGVGKTSVINRIIDDEFQDIYSATIGLDLKSKQIKKDNRVIKLDLWDTAGQEKFRSISSIHYKGADIIMCIFDLQNRTSFDSLVNDWLDEIAIYCSAKRTKILILGNKCDMVS